MGFRTKFCAIAGPIVLVAAIAQGCDSDPAPVESVPLSIPQEEEKDFVINDVDGNRFSVYNNTDRHIWMMDFKIEYYSGDGEYNKISDPARLWDIPVGEERQVVMDFDFPYLDRAEYFRVVQENATVLADNDYGIALAELGVKRNTRPLDLTETECYTLRGYAPETPCEGFKAPWMTHFDIFGEWKGDRPPVAGQNVPEEVRAAIEFIEDGTMDYASEISGR